MAIVIGDHVYNSDDDTTHFVVLIDMVPQGGMLNTFTDDGDVHNQINIPPSSVPLRIAISAPKYVTSLHLVTPEGGIVCGKLDHRDSLGILYLLSCDLPEADTRQSLWETLLSDLDNIEGDGRSLVIHIGDNVYADMCWNAKIQRKLASYKDIYRARYRKTWFGDDHRSDVYAKASHLMLMDDHEVTNNFMDGRVRTKRQLLKYEAAMDVYTEYQESLLYNDGYIPRTTDRGWIRVIGNDLIITIDRSTGTLNLEKVVSIIKPIIEHHRKQAILDDTSNEETKTIVGVILVFSTSMIPYPRQSREARKYTRLYGRGKFVNDDDLSLLYRYLFTLVASNIAVLLVGGDLHMGLYATITDETGFWSFDVVVASPISNHPTLDRRMLSRGYRNTVFRMKSGIAFVTHTTQGKRCYAKVTIREHGYKRYNIQMAYSMYNRPVSYWDYYKTLFRMA